MAKGTLLQLKANGIRGQAGTFRTNLGALNPSNTTVAVAWTLYDKNSAVVSTGTKDLGPFGVIAPTEIRSGFFFDPKTADLSDAWVSYSATAPLLAYASVLDNASEDQTFIPAVEDKGTPPPQNITKEFFVSLQDFSITFSPAPSSIVKGDKVTLHIDADSPHSFRLFGPTGQILADVGSGSSDRSFTVDVEGLYQYTCNTASCGFGHVQMNGSFTVGKAEPPDTGRGY
jgi:plastocyanin